MARSVGRRPSWTGAVSAILGCVALLVVMLAVPAQEVHAAPPDGKYPPPFMQVDVSPFMVQCNEPRELYLNDLRPLCLFPGTPEALQSRGMTLIKAPILDGAATLQLAAQEMAWLEENPVIRVSYDPYWFPIEYVDESGSLAGVTLEYVKEFESITGVDFEPVDITDWTQALDTMREGTSDIVVMVARTPERAQYMGFTTPHYTVETRLVTLDDMRLNMDDPDLRVLTIRNYEIEDWLDENYPSVGYVSVDGMAQGLDALQAGEADALAAAWPVARGVAQKAGMEVYDAGPTGHAYHLSVGYRDDQPILGSIMQKILDSIPPSTLDRIQGGPVE